jgi:hypothetical protein
VSATRTALLTINCDRRSTRWTKSWTAVVPIEKTDGLVYEFACHEGNYGLRNILAVARAQEKIAAETNK